MAKSMIFTYHRVILTLLLIILVSPAIHAGKKQYSGTVIMRDSVHYDSVRYDVDTYYKVLKVDTDEGEKNLSFSDIEAVYDNQGNDVTNIVLGGKYRPEKTRWKSEIDPEFQKARAKPWNVAINLGAGFSVPIGKYYEGIDPGLGTGGDFLIAVNREYSIRLSISNAGLKLGEEFQFVSIDPEVVILSQNNDFNSWRFLGGVQYTMYYDNMEWYLYSSLGAVKHTFAIEVNTNQGLVEGDYSETKFMTSLGFGGIAHFSPKVGFNFGMNLDVIYVGSTNNSNNYSLYGNVQTAIILDFKGSLIYFL